MDQGRLVREFFSKHIDALDDCLDVVQSSYSDALELLDTLIKSASTDDELCWVGVWLFEPLFAHHADKIDGRFEQRLKSDSRFRKALACVEWSGLDEALHRRMVSFIPLPE